MSSASRIEPVKPTAEELALAPEPAPIPQAATPTYIEPKADLIYGPTDSGKTANLEYVIKYVLAKHGQLSRIVTADGGGIGPLSGLAKSGLLEVWSIAAWKEQLGNASKSIVIAAMAKAVRGCWPAKLDDPESPMLAPDDGTWEIYGYQAFEGLTSWGDQILLNLQGERASLSQDPSYTFVQAGESFSGGNQSYYGFIQNQLYAWVSQSHLLPFKKITWTALESRGEDKEGTPTYGPSIAGKKALSKAPAWFANTIHIDVVDKPAREVELNGAKLLVSETERVMWLKSHADPKTKIVFPCKVRVPIQYSKDVPAYIAPNLGKVYEMLDELEAKQTLESTKAMNDIEQVRERLLKAAGLARERQEKAAMAKRVRSQVTVPAMPSVPGPVPVMPSVSKVPVPVGPGASSTVQPVSGGPSALATPSAQAAPAPAPVPAGPKGPAPIPEPGKVPVIQTIKREAK